MEVQCRNNFVVGSDNTGILESLVFVGFMAE